jgi:hypothetical protein
MVVMAGGAGLTVNETPVEAPPAVTTVMVTVPAPFRLAGTAAVN